MKKYSVLCLLFIISTLKAQEFKTNERLEMVVAYKMGIPSGNMGYYIHQGHGFSLQMMAKPKTKIPLWIGGNLDFLIYGSHTTPQLYTFPNGSTANVDVNVNSTIVSYQLAMKYQFPIHQRIEPYAMLRMGGASFTTNLYIDDPSNGDECVALEQDILHKSNTFNLTPALGSRIFFDKYKFLFLDFNVGYTLGGEVSFMIPTKGEDMTQQPHHNLSTNSEAQPYYADFINRNTQIIHKHHVGNIYNATFKMIQLRLGIGINF